MKYNIETKNDGFGLTMIVHFPEGDLDQKALYTIQADQPDFLIPFHYRSVNGQAECAYQIGNRSLLKYHYEKEYATMEYVRFWEQILQPLVDCEDWFLNPLCFVLDTQYLYTDGEKTSYLYVPSREPYSDMDSLRAMATALSRENSSRDTGLYSKVLLFTTQNFQPSAFLQMLHKEQSKLSATVQQPDRKPDQPGMGRPVENTSTPAAQNKPPVSPPEINDDIYARFLGGNGKDKAPPKQPAKKQNFFGRLFGKKEEKEIFEGAGSGRPQYTPSAVRQTVSPTGNEQPASVYMPEDADSETRIESARFLLVGRSGLPAVIAINIQPGESFTIGRHDVKARRILSDFEFPENTEAVSRKHAAVERTPDGSYMVLDLNSKAGTFVDKERLSPNVPHRLSQGNRVSFGTAGAEYLWEA